jgi:hypothetical protein
VITVTEVILHQNKEYFSFHPIALLKGQRSKNCIAMKRVLIQDDDEDLFNVPLQPILYHYYKENLKEIRRMVKQQVKVNL